MKILQRVRAAIAQNIELPEVFVICGLGCVGYGVSLIHQPSAWIVVGAVVFALGMRR